jgi:hypothetical protein
MYLIYYTGIFQYGKLYFWVFENEMGIVINGQWEEENISYEFFGKFIRQKKLKSKKMKL